MKRKTMKKLSDQRNGETDLTDLDLIVLEALGLQSGFCNSDYNSFFEDTSEDLAAVMSTTPTVKQEIRPDGINQCYLSIRFTHLHGNFLLNRFRCTHLWAIISFDGNDH